MQFSESPGEPKKPSMEAMHLEVGFQAVLQSTSERLVLGRHHGNPHRW